MGCNLFKHCAVRPLLLLQSLIEHMMFSTFLYVLQPSLFLFTHSFSLQSMYIAIILRVVFEIAYDFTVVGKSIVYMDDILDSQLRKLLRQPQHQRLIILKHLFIASSVGKRRRQQYDVKKPSENLSCSHLNWQFQRHISKGSAG